MNIAIKRLGYLLGPVLISTNVWAAADHYTIDPSHTYPSFEAPHISGISIWRGKIDKSSGTVTLDRANKTGTVDITMDASSIDFGMDKMNEHAKSDEFFDVTKYPKIRYQSKSITFNGEVPVEIDGELTMHGVTKSVPLTINSFKCIIHPYYKKEVCGADASAQLDRGDFGINSGIDMVGSPIVKLAIQVEAMKDDPPSAPR